MSARPPAERWFAVAVIGALVLPLVVAAVRALVDGPENPGGDQAILQVRVSDVGRDTPVLGSYSRFGVNHPGPLWLYALWAPWRLLGEGYGALQVGALLAGAASLAVVAWIAWSRGGRLVLLWTAALLAVFVHSLGPTWVADPWEPKGLTLVVAALLFVTFDAVVGRRWSLPAVGVLASVLAQAYATLAVFAVLMGVLALGTAAVRAIRSPPGADRRRLVATIGGTLGLVLLLWAPPLLQQVRNEPGNLSAFRATLEASELPLLGPGDAWRAVSLQLSHRPGWLGVDAPLVGFTGEVDAGAGPVVPLGLVALVVAAGLAVRRRRPVPAVLAGVVVVGVVAGVVSLARLIGPLFIWIPSWTQALGLGAWVAIGWCLYAILRPPSRDVVGRIGVPVLAVVLAIASAMTVRDALRERPPAVVVETIQALADEAADDLDGTVLVRSEASATQVFGGTELGLPTLVLALDDAGADVVVAEADANKYGDRRAQPDRATAELRLVNAEQPLPPGFRVVATADPVSAGDRAERAAIEARIPALAQEGPAALREVAALVDDPELGPLIRRHQELPDHPALSLVLGPPPDAERDPAQVPRSADG